jgi:hypothetical protein
MILDQTILMKALEWSYGKALTGAGPFGSAYDLSKEYLGKYPSKEVAIENLINWQVAKCATSGFITGLGGLIMLPLAIPANLSSVLLIQLRMIAAVAILSGYDPDSEQIKSLAFVCLTGSSAPGILREAGIKPGHRMTERTLQNISKQVMGRINYLVKVRLLTKSGKIGMIKFGKAIPLLGGLIGGTIDASSTKLIGRAAKQVFAL